tara:strand:+ start:1733 stop:1852 length:120 start_codon:yes stop_codon:yes gene_type:complete
MQHALQQYSNIDIINKHGKQQKRHGSGLKFSTLEVIIIS